MAVTFFWRCEGTTLSATDDLPGADTSATANGAPAISATAAMVGSNGILINAASEYYSLDSEDAVINAAAGAIGFWLRIQTFTDVGEILNIRTNSAAANDMIRVVLSTTTNNHLRFRHRNSSVGSSDFDSTTALSNDTTYFVIFKWDQSASDRRCEIYDSGGTEVGSNEDLTTGWTTPIESYPRTDGMSFGENTGITPIAYYLDNIFIGTAYADGTEIYNKRDITTWATGRTTKNSRAFPLGVEVGMNVRGTL